MTLMKAHAKQEKPDDLSSWQVMRPLTHLSPDGAYQANRAIILCYLLLLIIMMIMEFSGWTYVFDIWPLSSLVSKAKNVLLLPVFDFFDLFSIASIQIIAGAIFVADALVNGLGAKKLVITVIGILLSCILCSQAFNDRFAFFLCFVIAYPHELNLRSAIKTYLVTGTAITLLTICLALLGLISTVVSFEHGILRQSWGFTYTNGLAVTACSLIMAWVYLKAPTWSWQDACVALALTLIVFTASDGRSACAFVVIQVILISLTHAKRLPKIVRQGGAILGYWLTTWLFLILAAFTLVLLPILGMLKETPVFNAINALLSTRPAIWLNGLENYGVPLLHVTGDSPTLVDNSFLHIVWTCGIVVLAFFAVLYVLTGKWTKAQHDFPLAIYIVIFIAHCFTETLVYEFNMGFMILPIGAALANAAIGPASNAEGVSAGAD